MTTAQAHKERVYGPVDYLLTGIYACLAAFATDVSVGSTAAAWLFVGIIAFGTLFSFAVQWLIGDQEISKYDGLLYMLVGIAVFVFHDDLNKMVPDQPFQDQLMLTGTFCWLLALGSFFTWRDGTLLFQAVPSIALFGMVGIFDTFKATPFLFFALLVCLATLFARAHRRQMIEQAEASGYKAMLAREEAAGETSFIPGGARLQAILQGPWKWMAGPEWALASALAIVMISLLGAPVLRLALHPYAGVIKIPPPPLTTSQLNGMLGRNELSRVPIGQGPPNLSDRIVLLADTGGDKRYLRLRTYGTYSSLGWGSAVTPQKPIGLNEPVEAESIADRSLNEIQHKLRIPFTVTVLENSIDGIPVPGEIEKPRQDMRALSGDQRAQGNNDGTISVQLASEGDPIAPFSGVAVIADPEDQVRDADTNLPPSMQSYLDKSNIPADVMALAQTAAAGKKTDFEKAEAIQKAIETRCMYNLKAPRTPGGQDPVEYFLFTSHQGYCDVFASSMALMARSVGIPARYVTGFYPIKGTHPDGHPEEWSISESEGHAWAELFFKNVGWVSFDATEGAAYAPGEAPGDPTAGPVWYKQAWFENFLDGAIIVALIGGSLYIFLNYRKYRKGKVPSRNDVGLEYARFVGTLQKVSGRRRLPWQTPNEYLLVSKESLGPASKKAEELNEKFVEALYSPVEISEGILKQLHRDTDDFRREAKSAKNGKQGKPTAGSLK